MNNEKYHRLAIKASGVSLNELNSILEFQINSNHEISVKQCSRKTKDRRTKYGYRPGRFNLNPVEHNLLQYNGGLYLFIVHTGNLFSDMRFLAADQLPYKRLISWPSIWSITDPENIEQDIIDWSTAVYDFFMNEEDFRYGL